VVSFSNYSTWVDTWAPGAKLATNHLTGVAFEVGGPIPAGIAYVDGMSFSAPNLAALIADHVRRDRQGSLGGPGGREGERVACSVGAGGGTAGADRSAGQATFRRFSSSMIRGSWRSQLRRRMSAWAAWVKSVGSG
jgi:hypothetical protein